MRPAALAAVLSIGVVGLVAGCGGGSSASTTTASPATTQSAAAAIPMSARVLRDGEPAGFTPRPPEVRGIDMVGDISDSDHAEGDKQALRNAGFVEGTLGRTNGADGTYAVSFALRLDSAAGTAGLLDTMYRELRDTGDPKVTSSDLPLAGIPGGKAVTISGSNEDGPIRGAAAVFADGPFVYGIQVAKQGADSVDADLRAAAMRLYARVKGAPLA
jgi:hypothetical protein